MDQAITRATGATPSTTPPQNSAAPRSWAILLTSENHGTVGPVGCAFPWAGEKHERVLVVEVPAAAGAPSDQVNLKLVPAPSAPVGASVDTPDGFLLPGDMEALARFYECAEDFDSGGHDVPKEAMRRLVEIGVVRPAGPGRHMATSFGDYVMGRDNEMGLALPLKTLDQRNQELARRSTPGQAVVAPAISHSGEGEKGNSDA